MKRTSLIRRTALKRSRPRNKHKVPAWKIENLPLQWFREAAAKQRTYHLPGCKTRGKGQAHHVVYEQHCKRLGINPHDRRNAFRVGSCCHFAHHQPGVKRHPIPTRALPDAAIEFAFEVMGLAAWDYFRRYYDGADGDPRIWGIVDAATEMGQ